jgi:hypothetical protein
MGFWNCSDSVALFVLLWDFETVLTVCHYLFYYWTLELFREIGIIGFSFFYWTLELFRQCGSIKTNKATLSEQFQSPIEK